MIPALPETCQYVPMHLPALALTISGTGYAIEGGASDKEICLLGPAARSPTPDLSGNAKAAISRGKNAS